MSNLTLIRTQDGETALLTKTEVTPNSDWVEIQKLKASPNAKWFRAYPTKGGSMLVQTGTFEVIREANEFDVEEACFDFGFNPAAKAIQALFNN